MILDIFQYAHNNTVSPRIWHQTIIAPLYKKGDCLNPKNLRPIVLRRTIAKIYEINLLKRIRHVIEWGNNAPPMDTNLSDDFYGQSPLMSQISSCLQANT
jgi:hypothetical protein